MPGQGRLGDKSQVPADAHGCPGCPHLGIGPAVSGSPTVFVNGRPALRVDDMGIHAACCGPNMWKAQQGSATVFINGKSAFRMNDPVQHCGGQGKLIEGSDNVIIGGATSGGGGSAGASSDGGGGGSGSAGSSSGGGSGDASGSSEATSSSIQQSSTTPSQHWTEFRFRDAGGRAIAGAHYRIKLSDGREAKGMLNSAGAARSDQIPSGNCRVELADIEKAAWSASSTDAHASVELAIETSAIDAGESVRFEVFRLYRERSGEAVATLSATLDAAGRARATWTPSSISAPNGSFIFKASARGVWRKSDLLIVRQAVMSAAWSSSVARAGDGVTLTAQLCGVHDGERATIKIMQKLWRAARDAEVKQLTATASGGAVQVQWTVPTPAAPLPHGDSGRRDLYFTVETGGLYFTSGLLAVFPREESP